MLLSERTNEELLVTAAACAEIARTCAVILNKRNLLSRGEVASFSHSNTYASDALRKHLENTCDFSDFNHEDMELVNKYYDVVDEYILDHKLY